MKFLRPRLNKQVAAEAKTKIYFSKRTPTQKNANEAMLFTAPS